jgi:choline monooxygenase
MDLHTLPDLTAETLADMPVERAETIPSSWYTHPGFHTLERDTLFARSWQYVGHTCRLQQPGDYLALDLAGSPVLVVRDRDGGLRAFYNVCRHRGGPLVMEACGTAKVLQCQYHGWTYLLDGSLRGVPRFGRSELFDKKDYGLVPLEVALWQELVFVRLKPAPDTLETLLDGIAGRIAPMRLDTKQFIRRDAYDIGCNWKVYVDNYLEGYHIPLVHPELNDVLDYRAYVTETYPHYSLQYSPFKTDENPYGIADGEAFYYFVYPNMMFNILPGRLQMNLVLPLAADRCRVLFDYYYDDPSDARRIADDLAFSDLVQQQDGEICEAVQRGLQSDAYDRGRFSPEMETGVHHFQSLLRNTYRHALGWL